MSVTLEDKEDISGNPLLLVSHIRPMELGMEGGSKLRSDSKLESKIGF